MGTVALVGDKRALAEELGEARALVERGEVRAALKLLERVRRVALAKEQVPALEEVLALGELISRRAEGKLHDEADRLLYSARQNIRFIAQKQALAEERDGGVDWVAPPIGRPISVSDATVGSGGRLGLRRPRYERRVWLKWLGLTVLVFVPVGALFGLLMPVLEYGVFPRVEPPPANWDSPQELVKGVPIGVWIVVATWSAIYFERVNASCRAAVAGDTGLKPPGFGLAVTALVFAVLGGSTGGWAFLPVAVVVAAVAWWQISATGTRYARGSATAATTFVVVVVAVAVVVGSVAWSSWSSGHASVSAPTASSQSASGLKRVVVGDLAIRVPAEWRPVEDNLLPEGTSMVDPRHEPAGAVTFSHFSIPAEPGATAAQLGKLMTKTLRADKAFSAVREKLVVLPSGIPAYEIRFNTGGIMTGVEYILVTGSGLDTRENVFNYQAIDSQAGHLAQFQASARSIEKA